MLKLQKRFRAKTKSTSKQYLYYPNKRLYNEKGKSEVDANRRSKEGFDMLVKQNMRNALIDKNKSKVFNLEFELVEQFVKRVLTIESFAEVTVVESWGYFVRDEMMCSLLNCMIN